MSRTANDITLVCYDIKSDRLRRKIEKCLRDFGTRLQFSVFLCRLDAESVSRCRQRLQKVFQMHGEEKESSDSLIIVERIDLGTLDCLIGPNIENKASDFVVI